MRNYIGSGIVFVGIVLLYGATIQLLYLGAGHPNGKVFAQMWFAGWVVMAIGLFIEQLLRPNPRK